MRPVAWVPPAAPEPALPASPDGVRPVSLLNQAVAEPPAAPVAGRPADARQEPGYPRGRRRLVTQAGPAQPAVPALVSPAALVQQHRALRGLPRQGSQVAAGVVPIEPDLGEAGLAEPKALAYRELPPVSQARTLSSEALEALPAAV